MDTQVYTREFFEDAIKENISTLNCKSNPKNTRNRASQILKVCAPNLNESSSIAKCKNFISVYVSYYEYFLC